MRGITYEKRSLGGFVCGRKKGKGAESRLTLAMIAPQGIGSSALGGKGRTKRLMGGGGVEGRRASFFLCHDTERSVE